MSMIGRSLATRVMGSLAGLTALNFAWESYKGNEANRNPALQAIKFKTFQDEFVYNSSLYSGNKSIDSLAMRWHNFWANVGDNLEAWKLHSAGITRDLVGENWHLLLAGGVGLGVGMGDWLAAGARFAGSIVREPAVYAWNGLNHYFAASTAMEDGARAMGRGLVRVLRFAGNNPIATLVSAATGLFFLNRFNNVVSGRSEEESFTKMVQYGSGGDTYGNPFGS